MVSSLMLSRTRVAFLSVITACIGFAAACQRVPLLAPSGSTITLTSSATTLPLNGTAEILANILELSGTPPHAGTHITFTTSLGSVEPFETETDINGRVRVTFNAGSSSGTATITAASGGASVSSTGALKIAIGAAAVGRIVLSANPGTVAGSGGTSTVAAAVTDPNGNPLGGVPVTFSTSAGSLSAAVVTTDSAGNAATILTTNRSAPSAVTHAYNVAGSFTIRVTAFDTFGDVAAATGSVTIANRPQLAVTLSASATPTAGTATVFTIGATATTGNTVTSVRLDFGDGSQSILNGNATSVAHVFVAAGTYTATAVATDSSGATGSASVIIAVGGRPGLAVTISTTGTPTVGVPVAFAIGATATSGASINSVVVNFGDGTSTTITGNTTSVQHTYSNTGAYTATATATDTSGASGSGSTVVTIANRPPLVVSISVTSGSLTSATSPTSFTIAAAASTGAAITSIAVDFGDGQRTTLQGSATSVQHTYAAAATYTVSATATDSSGASGTGSGSVTIGPAFQANFTYSKSLTNSYIVAFNGTSSTGTTASTTFIWDFGDGTATASGSTTTHTFPLAQPATYIVRLTITDGTRSSSTFQYVPAP